MSKKKIVVIGSGVGGLSCAALLAQAGYEVEVLEKNDYIGGACSSYVKEGFTFDRAVHILTAGMNGPFGEVLRRLGIEDKLTFVEQLNRRTSMIVYKTDKYIPLDMNINSMQSMLEGVKEFSKATGADTPKDQEGESSQPKGLTSKDFKDLGRVIGKMIMISRKKLASIFEEGLTLTEWLNMYSDNPTIHGFFAFIAAGFYAVSPKKASAGEILWGFKKDLTSPTGFVYPIGALSAIPEAFAEGLKKFGGKIRTNAEVTKVLVEDQKVNGVIVKGEEEIKADLVISNLDIKQTVLRLVEKTEFEKEYYERISKLSPSLSAMTFKIGFSEPIIPEKWALVNCYHMSLNDWKDVKGPGMPKSNGFFCPVMSNIDPKLAPKGKQSVIFGTIVPSKADWDKWIDIYYEDLCTFFPNLEDKKVVMDISLPKDITAMTGKPTGPVEGLALIPAQSGKNRPSSLLPIEGLFACGDTAGTDLHGIGTQLAVTSGKTLADHIIASIK